MALVDIAFNVNATIVQKVEIIHPTATPEEIASGLESGQLQTTISHQGLDTIGTTITEVESGIIIARIKEQHVEGPHEFYSFNHREVEDDETELEN